MRFIIRAAINAFALWVVSLMTTLTVTITAFPWGDDAPFEMHGTVRLMLTLLIVGALFGVVNTVIGTVIRIVAFPLYLLTLGLVSLVVNGALLWLTAWITQPWGWGLEVGSFGWGIVAALLIGLINWIFGIILRPQLKKR